MSEQATLKSNYVAYPEYKDSKIEWVGEIPSTWVINPAFVVFTEECLKNVDGREQNVLSLSYGSIKRRDIASNSGLLPESFNTYQIVNNGDIILRLTDLQNDKKSLRVGRSTQKGIITSAYMKLVSQPPLDSRYAYRLLHSYDTTKVFYGLGGGLRQSMKFDDFRRLPILVPSIEEQRTIAAFLDDETARIDSLIDKQQRLIELLKEKRQAVISHAVTKGLNPDAPMKDSGVEWLGQVPEHWVVSPLKYHCSFSGGGTPSKENTSYWNGSIPWVSPKDMKSYWITDSEDKITEQAVVESSTNLIAAGAVLIVVRSGILQRTIPVGINTIPVTINQDMKAIRFKSIAYAQYISMFIKGYEQSLLLDWRKQGATVESLEHEYLANTLIPFPPEEEVLEIIRNLTQKLQKFDQIECDTTKAISLLQERRTALISAAVTGKIDLRGWTQPVKEDAA